MNKQNSKSIEWIGISGKSYSYKVYAISSDWLKILPRGVQGNYIVAKAIGSSWQANYIGSTSNVAERLRTHDLNDKMKSLGSTHIHIHLHSKKNKTRQKEEIDLLQKHKPALNQQIFTESQTVNIETIIPPLELMGAKIRTVRTHYGLTQKFTANALGISPIAFGFMDRGQQNFPEKHLQNLSALFQLPIVSFHHKTLLQDFMALLPKVDSSKYQAERDRIKKFSRLDKKELNQENSENNKQNEEDDTVDEVVDHQSQPRFTDNNLVVQHDGTPVRFVLNFEIIANRIVAAIEEIVAPLDSLASMTGDENDSSPNNKTMVINSDSSLITFGIYGPWGAGKSTLMYALDQELQDSKYFKIKLNPWKWDGKGSIHSYVRRAVLRSASETLFRSRLNSFTKNLRLLNLSIWFGKRWLWVVFSALVAITVIFVWPDSASQVTPNANSSTPPKIEQSKWRAVFTGGTAFLLLILNSIGKPFKKWIEDTVSERMLLGDTSNIGAEALQKTYRELAQAAKTNKKRFVFFIDDLDRCMPDRVTDFVESIHSLTNAGCIVFVACDEEYLSAAINAKHESIVRHHPDKEEFGKQFIEKIVQIPFRIPSINENDIYELGLATKLNTLEESIDDSETFDGQDRTVEFKSIGDEQIESDENVRVDKVLLTQIFGELLDGHVKLLKLNLRQIKSLSNTITLLLSIFADDFRTESDAKRMAAFILADKLDPFWLDGHYFKNPISIGRIGGHQSVVRHLEAILGDETDILEDLYWRIGRQPTPPKTTAEKAALNI